MSVSPQTPLEPARAGGRATALLVVVCGALFLEGIDIAMLNVAVPAIAEDLGFATVSAHWVISAYALGYAGFMMLGGRTADLVGRRRAFLVSLAVFVAFNAAGGLATEAWQVVLVRFVTGAAAGFLTPAGFSIVTTSFAEGRLRDRALAVYGAVGAAGFTSGMVFGGLLTAGSWRWVFFAPAVLGAAIWLVGARLIPSDPTAAGAAVRMDVAGALTVTGGMVAMVFGLVTIADEGSWTLGLLALALAILLLAGFVAVERRVPAPLLRPGLLREGTLSAASGAALLFLAGFFSFQFALTLYLQDLRGWSPVETGLTFAVMGADLVLAPLLAPALAARVGNLAAMTVGLASALAAFVWGTRLAGDWGYWDLFPSLLLVAVAFALSYGPMTAAATEGLEDREHGVAGGVVYTAMQFGAALGLAVTSIVLTRAGTVDAAGLADHQRAMLVPAAFAALAVAVGLAASLRQRAVGDCPA